MAILACLKSIFEGFKLDDDLDRPIGLRSFYEGSDDELLNQLSKPVFEVPSYTKNVITPKMISKTAPAFSHVTPYSYSLSQYQNPFSASQKAFR